MRPTILILFSCLQFATSQSSDLESFLYQVGDFISAISTSQSEEYYQYDEYDENYQSDGYYPPDENYPSDKFYQSDQSNSCITSSGPAAGQPCVFPFTYNGITYNECSDWTYGGRHVGKRWCSTNTDRNGKHINGKGFYGFCPDTCGQNSQTNSFGTQRDDASCPPLVGNPSPPGCSKSFVEDDNENFRCQYDDDCPQSKQWLMDEGCRINTGNEILYGVCGGAGDCFYEAATCQLRNGYWEVQDVPLPPSDYNCDATSDLRGVQGCSFIDEDYGWECESTAPVQDIPGCFPTGAQPAAEGFPPKTVSPVARIGISSSCITCERLQQCPPKKPCKSRRGGCNKPYCTRRGKCWCPRN